MPLRMIGCAFGCERQKQRLDPSLGLRAEGTIGQTDGGDVLVTLSDPGKGYDAMQTRAERHDVRMSGANGNLYARELASFGDSIRSGKPLEMPARDAVHIQSVIEAIIKRLFGYRKVRYRGLEKNRTHAFILGACANLFKLAQSGWCMGDGVA